jgi:predicted DNA-binding transcriptional regulator YafY
MDKKTHFITNKQLAEFFDVHPRTIQRMVDRRDLPPMDIKRGHRKGWYRGTLDDYKTNAKSVWDVLINSLIT